MKTINIEIFLLEEEVEFILKYIDHKFDIYDLDSYELDILHNLEIKDLYKINSLGSIEPTVLLDMIVNQLD